MRATLTLEYCSFFQRFQSVLVLLLVGQDLHCSSSLRASPQLLTVILGEPEASKKEGRDALFAKASPCPDLCSL